MSSTVPVTAFETTMASPSTTSPTLAATIRAAMSLLLCKRTTIRNVSYRKKRTLSRVAPTPLSRLIAKGELPRSQALEGEIEAGPNRLRVERALLEEEFEVDRCVDAFGDLVGGA